ncbi:MAG: hypothetical protein GX347_09310 [Epulopiscium sp.]|nr:hypothetical protein [Candidatus Epulonipiscium sp.]
MDNPVNQYLYAKEELFTYFGCEPDYSITDFRHMYWQIQHKEGFSVITFSETQDFSDSDDAIIVKKDNQPMIYKTKEYTLVIGIRCVKVGFVFKNANHISVT